MKRKLVLSFLVFLLLNNTAVLAQSNKKARTKVEPRPKITFIELGSVNCIPCKKMQPIMKSIEKKYGGQVKVVFYDVWTPEQRKYAVEYEIRAIPTQVFLDKDSKELMRHEGFFPEEAIDRFLQSKGLKIL